MLQKLCIFLKENIIFKCYTNIKTEDQFAIRKAHGDTVSLGQKQVIKAAQQAPLTGC